MARRSFHYRSDRRQENRIINVVNLTAVNVWAVYDDQGKEVRCPIYLIGIFSDGSCHYLEMSQDGMFDLPEDARNFVRFEFARR